MSFLVPRFTAPAPPPPSSLSSAADGTGGVDVWCPLGASSDPIPFFRSAAEASDDNGNLTAATRSPTNYATAFLDLDFVYGRSEAEAQSLRTLNGSGFMNLTDDGLPQRSEDGTTWLVRYCIMRKTSRVRETTK